MKALVFGDLHAGDGAESCFHNRALSLQQWRVRKFYAELHRIFVAQRCDCLWDLGDTTSDRNAISIPTIDTVLEGLEPFPAHPWNIKVIGNHEMWLKSGRVNSGKLFQGKFAVYDQPAALRCGGVHYAVCPYPYDDDQLNAWLEAFIEDHHGDRVLLGHLQAVGSKMNSGESKSGVPKALLKEFKLALLGHIHKPQEVVPGAHYVGSPFQQDRGEAGEAKRVGVVDTDRLSVTWVPMEGFPEYRTVGFREFVDRASENCEDRYQVVLHSPEEAEQYYAHPLSDRHDPIYQYEQPERPAEERAAVDSWAQTRQGTIKKYLETRPPASCGVSVSIDELVQLASQLADE